MGYDLTLELPFIMAGGRRCLASNQVSVLLMCKTCGTHRFRRDYWPGQEPCYNDGTEMVTVALDELAGWGEFSPVTTTIEQRKAARLEQEAAHGWNWAFGNLTEADFPDGFAEVGGIKAPAYLSRNCPA